MSVYNVSNSKGSLNVEPEHLQEFWPKFIISVWLEDSKNTTTTWMVTAGQNTKKLKF